MKDKIETAMLVVVLLFAVYIAYEFSEKIGEWGYADAPGFDHAGPLDPKDAVKNTN